MSTPNSSQRRKVSPILVYYTKNGNGDYSCNICKQSSTSRELIIKRDKTGSTMSLWKHLENNHLPIYRDLKPSSNLNPLTNFFSKRSKYLGRTQAITKERFIDLIIKTDTPFATLENPEFEAFCSYFSQYDVSLPSANTLRHGLLKKFDDEKVKTRQLFQPIEKVSLTMDTWTTPNRLAILGVTIHWIDDIWNLHERVLAIDELCESHGGAHMTKVLHEILRLQFDGQGKIFFVFLNYIFFTKYLFSFF